MVYVQEVLDTLKACVIIPAYNEESTIAKVVKSIRVQGLEAVVIDDGSGDRTSSVSLDEGAVVLRNPVNSGKGNSLRKGFDYALGRDFDAIITMDGDGQHKPDDVAYFMRLAEYSKSSILIGNRMSHTKNMPWLRILTNRFMSWLISKISGQKIFDSQCGFRLIKKEVLEKVRLNTYKYETESEILIKASRLGFKIESVPIETIYKGNKSSINPFVDTLRFIRFLFDEIWTTRH
ncbi:MAG: glycosyltransferase family 2 protein [Candidatus Omnitrophica bacterium]|nr:glycosyltransferase family 2 protein [Candidatus Omnitrophota bacterium]